MAKKKKTGKIAKEIGAGMIATGAAAAAGYYLYGSKNAKKNRKMVAKELKADWKIIRREAQKTGRADVKRAKTVGKRVLARGKKTMRKITTKKAGVKKRKSR